MNIIAGADTGFQARGGRGALKKIAPSGGRCENSWVISCEKSRFYAKKKIIFVPILGGARVGCAPPPPWIRPCYKTTHYITT